MLYISQDRMKKVYMFSLEKKLMGKTTTKMTGYISAFKPISARYECCSESIMRREAFLSPVSKQTS